MAGGGNAIRGSRVGAGPMGEAERGDTAPRAYVSYFCSSGHETRPAFAADAAVPQVWDCPRCGMPANLDAKNPPPPPKTTLFCASSAVAQDAASSDAAAGPAAITAVEAIKEAAEANADAVVATEEAAEAAQQAAEATEEATVATQEAVVAVAEAEDTGAVIENADAINWNGSWRSFWRGGPRPL